MKKFNQRRCLPVSSKLSNKLANLKTKFTNNLIAAVVVLASGTLSFVIPANASLTSSLHLTSTASKLAIRTDTPNPNNSDNNAPNSDSKNPVDPALTQVVTDDEGLVNHGEKVEFTHGHVDIGPRFINQKWEFLARDDSGDKPVWRDLNDMVFRLPDSSILEVPKDPQFNFITSLSADRKVWVLPQTEITGVPWLGWNTQSPAVVNMVNGGVKLIYEGHEGDGELFVFLQAGNFGAPELLWDSTKHQMQPINIPLNTHTHVNWVFTKPGVHIIKLNLQATLNDGSQASQTKILRFAVGDSTSIVTAQNAIFPGDDPKASDSADNNSNSSTQSSTSSSPNQSNTDGANNTQSSADQNNTSENTSNSNTSSHSEQTWIIYFVIVFLCIIGIFIVLAWLRSKKDKNHRTQIASKFEKSSDGNISAANSSNNFAEENSLNMSDDKNTGNTSTRNISNPES